MDMGVKMNCRGFHDWVVQRVTAVLIAVYTLFLLGYIAFHHPLSYSLWHGLFSHVGMKIATLIVAVSVIWHAWIGLWTVFTDYVKNGPTRLLLEVLVIIALVGYLVWCIDALWG